MSSAVDATGAHHPRCVASDDRIDVISTAAAAHGRFVVSTGTGPIGSSPRAEEQSAPGALSTIEVLLAREQARHHGELTETEGQLYAAEGRAHASLIEQLRTDLSRTAAAALTALGRLELAAAAADFDDESDPAVERAAPALRTAAAALHSALTCHLAVEARRGTPHGHEG